VERALFEARRRINTQAELAGIRRAQAAAEAGMRAAAELLRQAEPNGDSLRVGGEALTCERIKEAIRDAVGRAGASAREDLIVSHGAQTASGHEMGSGPIRRSEPVVIDLWPREHRSACFADMTRTFVVGEAPPELRRYHELTRESLSRSLDAVRSGAAGREVFRGVVSALRAGGPADAAQQGARAGAPGGLLPLARPRRRARGPRGADPGTGAGRTDGRRRDHARARCYRPGFGGCRLEDLVLVTEDGAELLTDFPYDLEP
jgi:Xaa-Pro aminopeptidase